jgi:radical SAM protein with 4Fe4S-binding SPASM domain
MREGTVPPHLLQFSTDLRPVVVWNTTNRCNLSCRHCYLNAEDRSYAEELTTAEARAMLADLAEMRCPVVLFSGGEPLLREDLYELAKFALEGGLRPVLSTNGTLITPEVAARLAEVGMQYVGVSLDGLEETHDSFRGRPGAFQAALTGLRNAAEAGLKTGVRFTVMGDNVQDLPRVIDLVAEAGIPRFCMYHLVYSGRGAELAAHDTDLATKRATMDMLLAKTQELHDAGRALEILTVDNPADGRYLRASVAERQPERLAEVDRLLELAGGCSAGTKLANVDSYGHVHACQFWGHVSLGNVKERPLSDIWRAADGGLLAELRYKQEHLQGRCASCVAVASCGGCRVRAEAITGDRWAADPACYLSEAEIVGGG